jgi:putative acetyltransferase
MVTLRPYRSDDGPELLALFRDTIRRVNCRDYSPTQIAAWASDDIDPARWSERFAGRFVSVAEAAGRPVGFGELEADGHIDRFYVSADHQGRGIGGRLMAAIVAEARRLGIGRLYSEVSITARPFFEGQGFVVLAPQVVTCREVEFVNYRMEQSISSGDDSTPRRDAVRQVDVMIRRCDLRSPVATGLIAALNAELTETYPEPGATHFGLSPDEVADGSGAFLVVWWGGQPAGCGALRSLGDGVGELKRMYVCRDFRGRGLGRRLVTALEVEARALGLRRIVLETGPRQAVALRLYATAGFLPIAPFGEYVDCPLSVCMARDLGP